MSYLKENVKPWLILFLMSMPAVALGQNSELLDLSTLNPSERFDFLIGDWTYSFSSGSGTTTYRATHDAAVHEFLQGAFRGQKFTGTSIAYYDGTGWKRRWIDTLGNVIESTGSMEEYGDSALPAMISSFQLGENHFKHVWFNIAPDRFDTDLLVSSDGVSYRVIRSMPYVRATTGHRVPGTTGTF